MRTVSALLGQCIVPFLLATSLSAATIDGIPLHSSTSGTDGRTLILVHGWTCDDRTWELQVPALSKRYRVITLDLPGHGRSGSPKDGKLSMNLFARAIEAVRAEQHVERVVLAGHSMGTMAIMQYARLYPEHVAALVLVDGSVSMPADAPTDRMLSFAREYGESAQTRETAVQTMFKPTTTEEVRKKVLSMVATVPPATPLAAMEALVDRANWKEDVFPQPVLAVFSDIGDGRDPESNRDYMKTRFPKLEYHKMVDTGHFLMLEKPVAFNALLTSFIDNLK